MLLEVGQAVDEGGTGGGQMWGPKRSKVGQDVDRDEAGNGWRCDRTGSRRF